MVQEDKANSQRLHQAAEVRGRDLEDQVMTFQASIQRQGSTAIVLGCFRDRRSTLKSRFLMLFADSV